MAELEKKTQAFEMRCYCRLLNIWYKDHVTNEAVCRKIQAATGEYDEILTLVKVIWPRLKVIWFSKEILQGTVKKRQTEEEVGRQY